MSLRRPRRLLFLLICLALSRVALQAQAKTQDPSTSSSSSTKQVRKPAVPTDSGIDDGAVTDGVYRNKALALSCKIPAGWVLRTDELNARGKEKGEEKPEKKKKDTSTQPPPASTTGAKV